MTRYFTKYVITYMTTYMTTYVINSILLQKNLIFSKKPIFNS